MNGLDEFRMPTLLHIEIVQLQRKIWHDKHIKEKQFQEGDWALLYDSRYKYFKGKLRTRWLGPMWWKDAMIMVQCKSEL